MNLTKELSVKIFGLSLFLLSGCTGAPKFKLTSFVGKPFEELRLELGVNFKKDSLPNPKDWNCDPADKCITFKMVENNACSFRYVSGIERDGKIIKIESGMGDILRCKRIPASLERVKDAIGNSKSPSLIVKTKNGDLWDGAFFTGFWDNGDHLTRVDAVCGIADAKSQTFENFRNCKLVSYEQKRCFTSACKDLSAFNSYKKYSY